MLKRMIETEEQRNSILKDLSRRMFEKFSNEYTQWKKCVDLAATLDVLQCFATYGNTQGHLCFPDIVDGVDGVGLLIFDSLNMILDLIAAFSANIGNGRGLPSRYAASRRLHSKWPYTWRRISSIGIINRTEYGW